MNKKDFIKEVSKRSGMNEYAINEIYNISSEVIAETLLRGYDIDIPKLGKFILLKREAKNLFGGKTNESKTCIYPSFRLCDSLKSRIKDGMKFKMP